MELLAKLTQTDGASGNEAKIRELIKNEISSFCDNVYTDAMGNLIAHKKGNGKKIMFAAHMDEIGIIVTYIDDKGFLRFHNIGGLYVKQLVGRRVRFDNGIIGVIGCEEEEFNKKAAYDKLYIDIGAKSREDALSHVSIGKSAVFTGEFCVNGKTIISKALDNRAGCYMLISAIKKLQKTGNDLYFVFTTQEEVGLRGARASAFSVNPDYAVAVDVTDTGDTPSAPVMAVDMGSGAAIKVMDRSVICDSDIRIKMVEVAKKYKIPYQMEIMTDGGTDAGAIHLTREGIKTGGVSLPVRYVHSPSEVSDMGDLEACCELIKALAEEEWI